jgi:hypothetical protein
MLILLIISVYNRNALAVSCKPIAQKLTESMFFQGEFAPP